MPNFRKLKKKVIKKIIKILYKWLLFEFFLRIVGTENKTKSISTNPCNFTVHLADSMLYLKHIKEKFDITGIELSL